MKTARCGEAGRHTSISFLLNYLFIFLHQWGDNSSVSTTFKKIFAPKHAHHYRPPLRRPEDKTLWKNSLKIRELAVVLYRFVLFIWLLLSILSLVIIRRESDLLPLTCFFSFVFLEKILTKKISTFVSVLHALDLLFSSHLCS